MFNRTFLVMHMAETKQKLEIAVSQAASVAQTYNCLLTRLDFSRRTGLCPRSPGPQPYQNREKPHHFGAGGVRALRHQELFMGGDAMYYGLNALSNNMILLDRKQSEAPTGWCSARRAAASP